MNENINLTQILKDCPRGTEFYSSIFGKVSFLGIDRGSPMYPILVKVSFGSSQIKQFTKQGKYYAVAGECILFPSEDQRDWNKFIAPWYNYRNENYKKEKFDPKSLRPFNQVLVRDDLEATWFCTTFSHTNIKGEIVHTASGIYAYCIPYNEDTMNLVGTREEPSEYYCYWKD